MKLSIELPKEKREKYQRLILLMQIFAVHSFPILTAHPVSLEDK